MRHQRVFSLSLYTHTEEEACGHKVRRRLAVYKPEKELSAETKHAGTLISDLWPPEPWENTYLLFKHPVYGILYGSLSWQIQVSAITIPFPQEETEGWGGVLPKTAC